MITTDAPEYEYLSLLPKKIQISGKWVCKNFKICTCRGRTKERKAIKKKTPTTHQQMKDRNGILQKL